MSFRQTFICTTHTTVDVAADSTLIFDGVLNLMGQTLTKTGDGTLAINNRVTLAGGTVVGAQGTISGAGTIGGDVDNQGGTISPGNSLASSEAASQVPEPSSLWLLGMGLLGLTIWRRCKCSRA